MSDREPAKTSWWHSTPVMLSAVGGRLRPDRRDHRGARAVRGLQGV